MSPPQRATKTSVRPAALSRLLWEEARPMRIGLALLMSLGGVACSSVGARIPAVEFACEVEKCPVRFEGNSWISDSELRTDLTQRESTRGDLRREMAPLLVRAAYYDRGFVDVRVTSHAEQSKEGGQVLIVAIDEGSPYWVKSVTVHDPSYLPGEPVGNAPELRAALSQSVGALFARHVMIAELQAVLSRYRELGYAWADANVAVRKESDPHSISVEVTVERGPASVVDRVDVTGGEAFAGQALQDRVSVRAGESYRESAVVASSKALTELVGPARRVEVSRAPVAGHPDRVALTFAIRWIENDSRERSPQPQIVGWSP
jgi:outer membrane protein assembly factor BamA